MHTTTATSREASVRYLLAGIVDYAGLFPPASLSLDESIRNYARYLDEPEAWMLGRFICPAARLHELAPYLDELFGSAGHGAAARGPRLLVSALGRGGRDAKEFERALADDLAAVSTFRELAGDRALVDTFETRIPDSALESAPALASSLARACAHARLRPFAEINFAPDWRSSLPRTAIALAEARVGYKLRTGGVEASAFPSTEQIAAAIVACRDAGSTMKFTAGLHHPLRHYDESLKANVHGFLNVFVACALAWACGFDDAKICRVLDEQDPCCFRFRDYGLSLGEHAVSNEQIAVVRGELATSFGSCSFDEPREDLRALKLL